MNAKSDDNKKGPIHPSIDPGKLAEARQQAEEHLEHVRSLKEKVKNGTAKPQEEEEYDDLTWWLDQPMPALPPPEETPNPWELPRPPKKRNGNSEA